MNAERMLDMHDNLGPSDEKLPQNVCPLLHWDSLHDAQLVGTIRVGFNRAAANSAANSSFVRSRPPMMSTGMSRSFPQLGSLPGTMTLSTTKTFPFSSMAAI